MLLGLLLGFAPPNSADLLLANGKIYTGLPGPATAEVVVVSKGRIVAVGPKSIARGWRATRTIDLRGSTLYPGFTDSHFHIAGVGERELTFNLEGVPSLAELLRRLKAEVDKAKPGQWISGRGWIENRWKPQRFPTRQDLDAVSPNNPVYLVRADGHAGVANSLALRIAKVDRNTKDPFGGKINRDENGDPTGMLLDAAQGLVFLRVVQKQVPQDEALIKGAEFAVSHGLCEVQIAGGSWSQRDRLQALVGAGKIKTRIYVDVYGPGSDADRLIAEGPTIGERFTCRGIKVVFDGALGSRGAALNEPYSDSHDTSGFFTAKPELVAPMLERALAAGIQVETHAIGDRANHTVLDLYEAAFKAVPVAGRPLPDPRWRIEHAQIIQPSDIPRFASLGVIPSMQPSHAIGDLYFAPARLGESRLAGAYAWKSLVDSGAKIAAGSDAPVERGDPLIEFYAAVGRRSLDGFQGKDWHPEQAVSREVALRMLTLWPAYAAFEERSKGSIEVGKLADFTVLSTDIMSCPLDKILKAQVVMTIVDGQVVYRR